MPGANRTYIAHGKKRTRRTPYRFVSVREHDWYNIHRLSDRLRLSIADTFGLLVSKNLEALGLQPTTAEDLAQLEKNSPNP